MSTMLAIKSLRIPGDTPISQPFIMKTVRTILVIDGISMIHSPLVEAEFAKLDRNYSFYPTDGGG